MTHDDTYVTPTKPNKHHSPITKKNTLTNRWNQINLTKYRQAMEPHDWNYK